MMMNLASVSEFTACPGVRNCGFVLLRPFVALGGFVEPEVGHILVKSMIRHFVLHQGSLYAI